MTVLTQAASGYRACLLLMYRCVGPAAKGPHLRRRSSEDFYGSDSVDSIATVAPMSGAKWASIVNHLFLENVYIYIYLYTHI